MKRVSSHTNQSDPRWLRSSGLHGLLHAALALSRTLEGEMDRALAIAGVGARAFVALDEIASEPPSSQRHLAARLGLDAGTTSELLKRLERRRLVDRRPDGAALSAERRGALASTLDSDWSR